MIGIVVVSHSRSLARAAVALAGEMLHDKPVRIEIAAGLDETALGTDAVAVADAIAAADTGDGVLILMDLGSAVLSAELALDLLETPHETRLCAAPIVEGLIAAAVSAAGGAGLDEAADEADNALLGKQAQLGVQPMVGDADSGDVHTGASTAGSVGPDGVSWQADNALADKQVQSSTETVDGTDPDAASGEVGGSPDKRMGAAREAGADPVGRRDSGANSTSDAGSAAMSSSGGGEQATNVVARFTVTNPHGLHARPASALVSAIRGRDARVLLRNLTTGAGPASGTSLTRIAALGVLAGHEIEIAAVGLDARTVVDRVVALAADRFGEAEDPQSADDTVTAKGVEAATNRGNARAIGAGGAATAADRLGEGAAGDPQSAADPVSARDVDTAMNRGGARGAVAGGAAAVQDRFGEYLGYGSASASAEGFETAAARPGEGVAVAGANTLGSSRIGSDEAVGRSTGPFPASAGIAIGPVWRPEAVEFELPTSPAGDPEAERNRLSSAIAQARKRIEATIEEVDNPAGTNPEAEIFRAHLLLLEDDELIGEVLDGIAGGAGAERAWAAVLDEAAAEVARLSDEYLRGRAADIRAVRDQVLGALLGRDGEIVSRPGILVAADLTPGQVAALDRDVVTGIVLAQGSPTAHSAILARSKGIPAIVGAGPRVLSVAEGTTVGFDGGTGRLDIDPDPETLAELTTRANEQRERQRVAAAAAQQPARTRDGATIHVAANVGSVADAADAVRSGADLAGLVRTEFLFLNRDHAPTVDEQERIYREIATTFGNRRIILRTLDVGGDKPLPYIRQPHEANPFLGLRGIRLALAHPELLRDQLRAIVRVAADHPVSLMFPMVAAVDEVRAARELLKEICPQDVSIELGIMVEIPATAAKAAAFAPHVDFFSIGTNDLTQYALAAERGNDTVAALSDPLDPGVLHLIDQVCRGAGDTRVAVCGEIAADPAAIPLLLGLGVTELSVAPPAIALTKAAVRDLTLTDCTELAHQALTLESAAAVRAARMPHSPN